MTPSRRPRSTWGRATRPLWTEEELALYVAARRRKSARIDPDAPSPTDAGTPPPPSAGAGAGAAGRPAASDGSDAGAPSERASSEYGPGSDSE